MLPSSSLSPRATPGVTPRAIYNKANNPTGTKQVATENTALVLEDSIYELIICPDPKQGYPEETAATIKNQFDKLCEIITKPCDHSEHINAKTAAIKLIHNFLSRNLNTNDKVSLITTLNTALHLSRKTNLSEKLELAEIVIDAVNRSYIAFDDASNSLGFILDNIIASGNNDQKNGAKTSLEKLIQCKCNSNNYTIQIFALEKKLELQTACIAQPQVP